MTLSRRTFVQSAGAAAALAILGKAPAARASNKSGLDPIILGSGEHQYECLHDWAQLPKTHAFGNTHGVAFDAQGNCHIKHTVHSSSQSPDAMCVFDKDGKFIRSWAKEYKGGAHGLSLAKDKDGEFLWLSDCNRGVVQKTTLDGKVVLDLPWPKDCTGYSKKEEYKPTNVAIVPSGPQAGTVFVADGYGKSWIHRYNAKGEYQSSFAGPGKDPGLTNCPHGIGIDSRGKEPVIVVADRGNRRLQNFSLDGKHLGFVTDELRMPCHFDFRGDLILIPDLEARVTLFDKNNKLVVHLGDGGPGINAVRGEAREKFTPGKFVCPHSAAFDKDGNIFVVEWVEVGRVTKLRKV